MIRCFTSSNFDDDKISDIFLKARLCSHALFFFFFFRPLEFILHDSKSRRSETELVDVREQRSRRGTPRHIDHEASAFVRSACDRGAFAEKHTHRSRSSLNSGLTLSGSTNAAKITANARTLFPLALTRLTLVTRRAAQRRNSKQHRRNVFVCTQAQRGDQVTGAHSANHNNASLVSITSTRRERRSAVCHLQHRAAERPDVGRDHEQRHRNHYRTQRRRSVQSSKIFKAALKRKRRQSRPSGAMKFGVPVSCVSQIPRKGRRAGKKPTQHTKHTDTRIDFTLDVVRSSVCIAIDILTARYTR